MSEVRESPTFGGMGPCAWLFANCWRCRKEFECRLSQDVQNGLVRGLVPAATLNRVGMPAEPRELWHCRELELRRPSTPAAPASPPSPASGPTAGSR